MQNKQRVTLHIPQGASAEYQNLNKFWKNFKIVEDATDTPTMPVVEYTLNSTIDNPEYGRVYVVRPSAMLSAIVPNYIFVNNVQIGITGNKSHLYCDMPEGKYCFSTAKCGAEGKNGKETSLEIDVTPGNTYYIKVYPTGIGFCLEIMNAIDGGKAIKKTKIYRVK